MTETENQEGTIQDAYLIGWNSAEEVGFSPIFEETYMYQGEILPQLREMAGYEDLDYIDEPHTFPPNGDAEYLFKDLQESFWQGWEDYNENREKFASL